MIWIATTKVMGNIWWLLYQSKIGTDFMLMHEKKFSMEEVGLCVCV